METEWPTETVAELQARGVLLVEDGNHGEYRPRSNEFCSEGHAFIRAADMASGRVLFDSAGKINQTALDRIRKGIGRPGDVLFSHKGTVGKLALVAPDAPPFVCSPQTTFWRALDEEVLDRRFLLYFMHSRAFVDQYAARKGETDMADYVSLTAQRTFEVPLLPPDVQREIARVLGQLDDKIELNRQMNETLEAVARSIFRSWFVDFDPVVAKAEGRQPAHMSAGTAALFPDRFVETEEGPIPAGWKPGSIADIARYVNGRNFTKNATGTGRMVIRIAELNSGPGSSTKYNEVEADPENTAYPDDIVFAWSGSLDVNRWHRDEALINQHIFKVICDKYPKWFVFFHLQQAMPFFQGIAADKATTMGHIKRGHLAEAELALPPAELIRRGTAAIEPLYNRIHANERQSQTLAAIRDTLLPALLSGEIRLGEVAREVAIA